MLQGVAQKRHINRRSIKAVGASRRNRPGPGQNHIGSLERSVHFHNAVNAHSQATLLNTFKDPYENGGVADVTAVAEKDNDPFGSPFW